jgi:hypothetical protein
MCVTLHCIQAVCICLYCVSIIGTFFQNDGSTEEIHSRLKVLSESNEDLEGASAEPVVDSRAPLLNVPSGCPADIHGSMGMYKDTIFSLTFFFWTLLLSYQSKLSWTIMSETA